MVDKVKRMIAISRPIYWSQFMFAYWWGVIAGGNQWDYYTWLGLFFFSFPMSIIIFGINDIADHESDAINARKNSAEGVVLNTSEFPVTVFSVAFNFLLFVAIFIIGRHYSVALCILGILIFSYVYSVKPFRLKSIPVIDSLSNGIWGLLIFLGGFFAVKTSDGFGLPPIHWMLILFFVATAMHAMATLLDYETDKKMGDRTISVFLGKRNTAILSTGLLSACFFMVNPANVSIRIFFALSIVLALMITLRPEPDLINKIKTFYFVVLAVPLPLIYLAFR